MILCRLAYENNIDLDLLKGEAMVSFNEIAEYLEVTVHYARKIVQSLIDKKRFSTCIYISRTMLLN